MYNNTHHNKKRPNPQERVVISPIKMGQLLQDARTGRTENAAANMIFFVKKVFAVVRWLDIRHISPRGYLCWKNSFDPESGGRNIRHWQERA